MGMFINLSLKKVHTVVLMTTSIINYEHLMWINFEISYLEIITTLEWEHE